MNVVLQPASGPVPQKHYKRTIRTPVDLKEIEHLLPSDVAARLRARHPSGKAPLWRAVHANRAQWGKLGDGDLVLFYRQGEFFATARVTEVVEDGHRVATRFWVEDPNDGQFDLLFFLDEVKPVRIPWGPIRNAIGWKENAVVQALTVLTEEQARRVLPLLDSETPAAEDEAAAEAVEAALERRVGGQEFATSAAARKAVEDYAMRMATRYFEVRGFKVIDRSRTQPFDLECRRGDRHLLVEVKGTQTPGDEIVLTYDEVRQARDSDSPMALFIQHDVELGLDGVRLEASGGRSRVVEPWIPKPGSLTPIAYRCRIS